MAHDDAGSQRSTKVQDFFLALGRRYPNRAATFNVVSATVNGLLDHLDRIAPILVSVLFYLRAAIAFMQTSWAPIVVGFLLCFFGGTYVLLITAVEAVRLLSWDRLTHSLTVLRRAYMDAEHRYRKEVMMANSRSATTSEILQQQLQQPHSPIFTDNNNNNIMSSYSIKLYVFASAADVGEVRAAAQTIFSALLTVVAALRVSMIRSMTLGGAVAKMLRGHTFLDRVLHDVMPADLQQWSTPLADVVLLLITLTAATFLQSFCGIIHTSIRGAFLCVEGFLAVMAEHNVLMPSSNYAHTPEMRELANVHHPRLGAPRSDGDDDDDGCTSDVLLRLRGEPASFASSFSASTRSDAAASSNSSNKEDDIMKNLNTRSVQAKVMIVLLSSMGICWQLAHRAGALFPLNLLLLPATMVEYALEWVSCLAIAAPMA